VFLRRRDYWRPDRVMISRVARMTAATAVMSAALLAARHGLVPVPGHHVPVVALCLLIATGLTAYGALAQLFGVFDARVFLQKGLRRLQRA